MLRQVFKYFIISIVVLDIVFDGEEVIKFTSLIQHYYEHQSIEKINFIEFIILHYNNIQHFNSSDKHQNLPFKDHQNCAHIHLYTSIFEKVEITLIPHKKSEYPILLDEPKKQLSYHAIWHPPKV